jgi:hypothetical protein
MHRMTTLDQGLVKLGSISEFTRQPVELLFLLDEGNAALFDVTLAIGTTAFIANGLDRIGGQAETQALAHRHLGRETPCGH